MDKEKIKVLLIEDDPMIVEMYKLRLAEEGYDILVTDKGSEAIEWAKKEEPAIVLLDVILPELDGFSILQLLKGETKTKKIPVLLMTNLGQESDRRKGSDLGAADYFVKAQHTPAEVVQKIKELIRTR